MKSASLIIVLAASLVAAQSVLNDIPACAKGCVTKFMSGSDTGCTMGDVACTCKNENFLNNIACCLADACNKDDQNKTVKFAKDICSAVSVQVPDKIECKKPSAASSSSTRSSSATGTAARAASSSTGAAIPMLAGAGNLAGALLAIVAAL